MSNIEESGRETDEAAFDLATCLDRDQGRAYMRNHIMRDTSVVVLIEAQPDIDDRYLVLVAHGAKLMRELVSAAELRNLPAPHYISLPPNPNDPRVAWAVEPQTLMMKLPPKPPASTRPRRRAGRRLTS